MLKSFAFDMMKDGHFICGLKSAVFVPALLNYTSQELRRKIVYYLSYCSLYCSVYFEDVTKLT